MPPKPISYRYRPLWCETPALYPAHDRAFPVPLGHPPSLPGLRGETWLLDAVILPNHLRSRIFSRRPSPRLPLFTRFAGTMGMSDCHGTCIADVRPWASRRDLPTTSSGQVFRGSPDSRTWCFEACRGSLTTRGSLAPCNVGGEILPSASFHCVGTPEDISRLDSPACFCPQPPTLRPVLTESAA